MISLPILPPCDHRSPQQLANKCFCRLHGVSRPVTHEQCHGCAESDSSKPQQLYRPCQHRQAPTAAIMSGCPVTNRHLVFGCALHSSCVLTLRQWEDTRTGRNTTGRGPSCCETCTEASTAVANDAAVSSETTRAAA